MVKGTSKRVIVVRSPDPRFFEQAVFFLREDALQKEGVSADDVLAEAGNVAASYMKRHPVLNRRLRRLAPLVWMLWGAAITGAVWGVTWLVV